MDRLQTSYKITKKRSMISLKLYL